MERQERSSAPENRGGVCVNGAQGERSRVRHSGETVGSETAMQRLSDDVKLGCSTGSYLSLTGDSLRICPSVKADTMSGVTGFSK